jgi:hypothetical protein
MIYERVRNVRTSPTRLTTGRETAAWIQIGYIYLYRIELGEEKWHANDFGSTNRTEDGKGQHKKQPQRQQRFLVVVSKETEAIH